MDTLKTGSSKIRFLNLTKAVEYFVFGRYTDLAEIVEKQFYKYKFI